MAATIMEIYINGTRQDGITDNKGLAYKLYCERGKSDNSVYIPGCAVDTPYKKDLNGTFSWHLEDQMNDLLNNKIQPKLDELAAKKEKLILKIYALSRGGIGAFWLCQKLKNIPSDQLEIHLAVVDPVPGNLKITSWFDKFFGFNYTWTNRAADLSESKNLKNILIFLANEPYAIAHASLLPLLPSAELCHSKVEIAPGGHSGLERNDIVHRQIRAFLNSNLNSNKIENINNEDKSAILKAYEEACQGAIPSRRGMQLGNEVITQPGPHRIYWNEHHQRLAGYIPTETHFICRLKDTASCHKSKARMLKEGFYNILASLWAIISSPAQLFKKKQPVPATPKKAGIALETASQPSPTAYTPRQRTMLDNLRNTFWIFNSKSKSKSPDVSPSARAEIKLNPSG